MKIKFFIIPLIIITFLITGCRQDDELYEFIGKKSDSIFASGKVNSLAIGLIKNGKVYKIYKGQLTNGKRPDKQTLYEIASLTKTFTGTLLARAVLDNKVHLDDDVRNYLPEDYPNLEYDGSPVTFRNLVTHTSGLPHMFPDHPEIFENPNWDELPYTINKLQDGFTRKQFLAALHNVTLDTIPGYKFNYSNAGANLLALCLERIYESTYKDLVRTYLLKPLNMANTYIGNPESYSSSLAKGLNANGIEMPARVHKELNAEGGIISNLDDMVKYVGFHLDSDNPVIKIAHQKLFEGRYGDYDTGLFWQIYQNGDKPMKIFQNGGAYGTSSWMTIIPEMNTGVFLITNVSGPEVHKELSILADKIIEYAN